MLTAVSGVFTSNSMWKTLFNGTKLNANFWGASSRYFFQYLWLFNMRVVREILLVGCIVLACSIALCHIYKGDESLNCFVPSMKNNIKTI